MADDRARADALSATALLNCLIRESPGHPPPVGDGDRAVHRLPATGRVLRVRAGRYFEDPEVRTPGGWEPLGLDGLVGLVARELGASTGVTDSTLPAEVLRSRDALAAILQARRASRPPQDAYLRSEQALVAGHRHHPSPKARGSGPARGWLPYAPEAHARFPLALLGVRPELLAEDGDPAGLDTVPADGAAADGYRLLPAHPWQLELLGELPAFRDGRLRRLGASGATAVPTSSVRTVYLPEADMFCKFSLDVRITNDIRRLWLSDLRVLRTLDDLLAGVFDDLEPRTAAVLPDRGYRTANLGDRDAYEALAVLVRDGPRRHAPPGTVPLLAAGIAEGFIGNPLDGLTAEQAADWWQRYLDHVVPGALHAYFRHGVVLECHLQNVLMCVDGDGLPVRALFRDHEGVRLVADVHADLLDRTGRRGCAPATGARAGWERLTYCLVTDNLLEIAGAIDERHPGIAAELWRRARGVFLRCAVDHGRPGEVSDLLASAYIPAKSNLMLRWLRAGGADAWYVPLANPLRAVR